MVRRPLASVTAALALALTTGPAVAAEDPTPTVAGTLGKVVIDADNGTSAVHTVILRDDEAPVLVASEPFEEVEPGSAVEVELAEPLDTGAGRESAVVDGSLEVLEEVASASDEADAVAALRTGVKPFHPLSGKISGQTNNTVTANAIAADAATVSSYWSDSTGGAVRFRAETPVNGPVYTGWGDLATCDVDQYVGFLDWIRRDTGRLYNDGHFTVMHTPNVPSCPFSGVALIVADGGPSWINGVMTNPDRWTTIAHELGHSMGLGHSNSRWACGPADNRPDGAAGQCIDGDYGDAYDIMGFNLQGGPGILGGQHLDQMGLAGAALKVGGPGTIVTLAPVGGRTGTRFLRFASGQATYYVEYRAAVGRDADLAGTASTQRLGCPAGVGFCTSTAYTPGVIIRRVDDPYFAPDSYLLGAGNGAAPRFPLVAGGSFITADNTVRLTVTKLTSSAATIQLTAGTQRRFAQMIASPDVSGDRYGDVMTVDLAGQLHLHRGAGGGKLAAEELIGVGWRDARAFAPGDWNGDGTNDLVAADTAGRLYLYGGYRNGSFGNAVQIGRGWSSYRIIPAGDVTGDRKADLLAVDSSARLWVYPGDGRGGFTARLAAGKGWSGFDLHAAGDMNADGKVDIFGIRGDGNLYYYAGRGGGSFAPARQVGRGWKGFVFASGADFNRDGLNDLYGRDRNGKLWYYAGRSGGTFASAVNVAQGW